MNLKNQRELDNTREKLRVMESMYAEAQLIAGLPFLEIKLVGQADFDDYVNVVFGTDRMGVPKGMVEIIP